MKSEWIWMGHAGHLCVASRCRFHLNTYVNGYIVSTVGEYWPGEIVARITLQSQLDHPNPFRDINTDLIKKILDLKGDYFEEVYLSSLGYEEIGLGRTFETMVFKAMKGKHACCPYETDGDISYMDGNNDAGSATEGHFKACEYADTDSFPDDEDD